MLRATVGLLLLFCLEGHAQPDRVGLWFTKEAVPYSLLSPFTGPMHPGGALTLGHQLKEGDTWSHWLYADLGGYYHAQFQTGAYLQARYQWERPLPHGFTWGLGAGLGYLRTFFPRGRYRLENNELVQVPAVGRSSATAQVATSLAWAPAALPDWQAVVQLQGWVEGPFAPDYGVPVFPHTFLQVGIVKTLHHYVN
ncbi:MAG TPA: hypothetical protein DCP28_37675 [Cytophagales bacterium]|nr:hypothetical protein [Cytophagales bacterium]